MNGPSLLELTLFVADVDRSFAFYTALGVDLFLVEEPGHPRHYDGALGNTAVQIYPADDRPATTVQLGFRVPDIAAIAHSVRKTNHAVLVEEGHIFGGITSEVAFQIQEHCFDDLDAPVERVCQRETPMPYSKAIERETMPTVPRVVDAVRRSLNL